MFSNVASAGTLGYIGVSRFGLGIPFVNPYLQMRMRHPALLGGVVYGCIGGALAALGGKQI